MDVKNIHRIHLVAICGTGMGSLAGMLKKSGYEVSGSDEKIYPPMSTLLEELGIFPLAGYSPSHIDPSPDLIIIGNAVPKENPEVQEVLKKGIPYLSFPQALSTFFLDGKKSLVVTGTHGKTTTSSLLAWTLESAGLDPGCMIGGWVKNFSGNHKLGGGDLFVVEGDEYDTAFFDKGPKFLHYRPHMGIITGIEFDHADIFSNLEAIQKAFERFVHLFQKEGFLATAQGDNQIEHILKQAACKVERFGLDHSADWSVKGNVFFDGGMRFNLLYKGHDEGALELPLFGYHNLRNSLAVIAIARHLDISMEEIRRAFLSFKGIKRRQEVVGEVQGVLVLDDFAHHPTAIRETLKGLRLAYPKRRLWAIFEPRSATSRRNIFQEGFSESLQIADCVVVANLFAPEKIPLIERLDPQKIVLDIQQKGKKAWFLPTTQEIIPKIIPELQRGDLVCIMSSGAFDGIHGKLLKSLENRFS